MFDPVQAPPLWNAFKSVNTGNIKADSRLRHQILDRARNQDFAGTRFRGDARADMPAGQFALDTGDKSLLRRRP